MRSMAVRLLHDEVIPDAVPAPAIRRCPTRPGARSLAFAAVIVSLLATLPALARTEPSEAKVKRIVPTTTSTQTRESPYVRMNRQHLEASGNGPGTADPYAARRPPKLAGQVQRR